MEWITVYNLLFPLIESKAVEIAQPESIFGPVPENPDYYSGPKFIRIVQEYDPSILHYKEYIEQRQRQGKGTSRRDFFYDILKEQPAEMRIQILERIVAGLKSDDTTKIFAIKSALLGNPAIILPEINNDNWNAERLQKKFTEIDQALILTNFDRAVTLSYTCLEGLYKSFIQKNIPDDCSLNEIVKMSRAISNYLKSLGLYPDEVCTSLITITATVNVSRNKFSESHFNGEAELSLGYYIRDLTNTTAKFILNHM